MITSGSYVHKSMVIFLLAPPPPQMQISQNIDGLIIDALRFHKTLETKPLDNFYCHYLPKQNWL